jgi:hypothetical protein
MRVEGPFTETKELMAGFWQEQEARLRARVSTH